MLPIIIMDMADPSDREFMSWLYEEYQRLMYRTARKYLSKQQDCEDLVQDCLVSFINNVASLRKREPEQLAGYVALSVKHRAYSFLRKDARGKEAKFSLDENLDAISNLPSDGLSVEESLLLAEDLDRLAEIWDRLSETDRLLLEGRYLLDYSDKQLAESLGCRPDSIRMKLTRARRRAYRLMLEEEPEKGGEDA